MTDWGIPELDPHRLATVIPTTVYGGDPVSDPEHSVFIWRTASLKKASGMVLGFYVCDTRFECVWRQPERYVDLFLRHHITTLCEPDFSVWTNDAVAIQVYNIYRTRWLARYWQDHDLIIIPSLSWSDERSFAFCFEGIPHHAPVVACESRTAGATDTDRRSFLCGLEEGVRRVQPATVCIYGGEQHRFWLQDRLPAGPTYHVLDSFMSVRGKLRAAQERHERDRHQLNLFEGGTTKWAGEVQPAAA
jgi:hypothetical protein